jgi:hypothetical protein
VSDVTTKIQIWNASTNGHVGHTARYPIMNKGVTCHTDLWKSQSSIHVVIIHLILLKYFGIAKTWWSVINEEITFPCYVVMCICMFTDILRYIPELINDLIQLFIYLTSITYSQGPYCRRSSIWHTTKYTLS